ncbi:MAG: pilus assembly protein PilM [Candidatus Kerfeldbacteria bacterium]|nr:pilus assembly protein PilM [Candidatus Kerfeldbacteria bacterium]
MGLFSRSNHTYLGVDIGSSSIKVVELKNEKNRPRLSTYGYMEIETDMIKSDREDAQRAISASLKKILGAAAVSATRCVSALPSFAVFSSVLSLPQMSKKELVSAVRWEAKKFVPMPLSEMILDWKVLESSPPSKISAAPTSVPAGAPAAPAADTAHPSINVLLTAAPKTLVQRYINITRNAGLELLSLETESFALERSLVGNDRAPVIIVDMGAISTDITVIVDKVPILNRSIDVGGGTMTHAIQKSLGIDVKRAEQFKRDFGLVQPSQELSSAGIPKSLEFVMHSIINEIRYIINLYQNQDQRPIEKIVLSGGTAYVPGLTEFIAKALDLKVFVGDPWARVVYPVDLKPVLQEIGPRFAIAIGLAMREIVS